MAEEPRKVEQAGDGLSQLKSLLFQGESRRLDDIERLVGKLDGRVGDARRLEKVTAEIIVEALREAEVSRHRELADAVAPVVVAAIRNEIKNSREMMVEALYPLTGQMVVAAVQNAFRELVAMLNQRMDALTSVDRWKLRMRSKLSGRPLSELAIERTANGRIVRIFFLEAGSGQMIESWRADGTEDQNADMVGGLIAALTGFARDALDAGANELRTLDLGGRKTYLRSSPRSIVAAEIAGELTREQVFALDGAFLTLLVNYGRDGVVNEESLRAFAAQVEAAAAPPQKQGAGRALKILALLLLVALTAAAGRYGARLWQERQINNAVAQVVAARPYLAAFPIKVATNHDDRRVELEGIVPSAADAMALDEAVRTPAGRYELANNFAVMATVTSLEAVQARNAATQRELEAARRELATATEKSAALERELSAVRQGGAPLAAIGELQARLESMAAASASANLVADLRSRIEALAAEGERTRRLTESVDGLSASVALLNARAGAPRARLSQLLDGFAIFFAERDIVGDAPANAARLDAIAEIIKHEPLGVRVVGHTDASGTATQNQAIARRRAEVVAELLIGRGVDRRKLVVLSRAASAPIAEQDPGARERNRRVTFETLYDNEDTP